MAEFNWVNTPPYGVCFGCGTSANDKGFVQTFTDVDVLQNGQVVGIADVFFCANCLYAMGRLVGTATPQETEEFARKELELVTEIEKLKDEIYSWQQRFLGLANLDVEDFEKLAKLERASKMEIVTDANGADPKPGS